MKHIKTHILALLLSAFYPAQAADSKDWKQDESPAFPADIHFEKDVSYLPEDRKERTDIYFPSAKPTSDKFAAILLMHGGGFQRW